MDLFDLYSCFSVAVETYAAELGIPLDRDLTVTGGMYFAGGPYNNYVLQATCRMADLLRQSAGRLGLVSSVSGILTKQAFGLWSRKPPPRGFQFADLTDAVARESVAREVLDAYTGPARVAGYTVLHEKGGAPRGIVVADVEPGKRIIVAADDPEITRRMETEDFCGRIIHAAGAAFHLADAQPRRSADVTAEA